MKNKKTPLSLTLSLPLPLRQPSYEFFPALLRQAPRLISLYVPLSPSGLSLSLSISLFGL